MKLTYADSPFFSNWSQTYFSNLPLDQHIANNKWFMDTLSMLKDCLLYTSDAADDTPCAIRIQCMLYLVS